MSKNKQARYDCRLAEWSKAQVLILRDVGSSPMPYFYYFFTFYQTLRAYYQFARICAISGPFLFHSRGVRELLDISLIHVLSRALCVSLVWKIAIFRCKNGSFLPFSYS